ncbi:hypothetical protein PG990_014266 [Apiospora arundinis]
MAMIPSLLLLLGAVARVVESANVCTYEGGWSLRISASTCPINAPVNCGNGIQLRCCPNGLKCAGEGDYGGSWCCKEGEDCRPQSSASPKCPDPTWTLWGGNGTLKDGGWCCEPGDNGFYRGNMEAVGCTAAGVRTLPTNYHFASTVSTVACVSPTSSASSSQTTASQIPVTTNESDPNRNNNSSSASLSGGAIAGIVVGAMCGMGVIAGIIALVWYRKKRARQNKGAELAAGGAYSPAAQGPPDMAQYPQNGNGDYGAYQDAAAKNSSHAYGTQDTASELGGVQRTEMPNDRTPHEMGNGKNPGAYHEME